MQPPGEVRPQRGPVVAVPQDVPVKLLGDGRGVLFLVLGERDDGGFWEVGQKEHTGLFWPEENKKRAKRAKEAKKR